MFRESVHPVKLTLSQKHFDVDFFLLVVGITQECKIFVKKKKTQGK